MDDWSPDTQPDGALTPPPRVPPVALATSAPIPPRPIRTPRTTPIRDAVENVLDRLDKLADGIAGAVGLR